MTIFNNTEVIIKENQDLIQDNFIHKDYLFLIFFLLLGFLSWSFYLYNFISKKNKQKLILRKSQEMIANNIKFENLKYLSIANLGIIIFINFKVRGISLIYVLISSNKTSNDLISFGNYICHIFPTMFFLSVFIMHVRFFVEKFYEITSKKKDLFFSPTFHFFLVLVYIILLLITIGAISN